MPEAWKTWEGQVINEEFPLLRYLGSSEHSAVFLTKRADRAPQEAAIKLILSTAENPELQLSWWELAARLFHPHLLRLFQRGRCQLDGVELLYAVTEYAEESLAQIIPYRPLTPAEARDMLLSVLDALAYVHGKGFVHGHIKPTNIMAVGEQIKVSSDGLFGAGESSRVLGTPSMYAAPEIAGGGGMSPASDVWSLGMTLVEALTQHPLAWEANGRAQLVLPATLPEPFFDIANHCLRRDPQRRWTVAEIGDRLQQTSLAPQQEVMAQPRNALTKWGYMVPAITAGILLLGILGSKLLPRHSSVETPTSVESSKQQVEADRSAKATSEAPSNPVPSKARSAAANRRSAKNAVLASSPGDPGLGAVVQQVSPDVSRNALRTIHGKVKVRVNVEVDSSGNVVQANFDSRGPSKYFADRALQAARRWTFKPPQVGGQSVSSEWLLKFEFVRSSTNVYPSQTSP